MDGRTIKAHRAAWIFYIGPIPQGAHVLHSCDNPPCCNPSHLFTGSNRDNVNDKKQKGRQAKGSSIGKSILTEECIHEIVSMLGDGVTQREIAAKFNVTHTTIGSIASGKTWRHVLDGAKERRTSKAGEENGQAKLTNEQVLGILEHLSNGGSRTDARRKFGASKSAIQRIATGAAWKNLER